MRLLRFPFADRFASLTTWFTLNATRFFPFTLFRASSHTLRMTGSEGLRASAHRNDIAVAWDSLADAKETKE